MYINTYIYKNMKSTFTDKLLTEMADKFKMLSDSSRLKVLRVLMEKESNVGEIVTITGLGQTNISKHLQLLTASSIVSKKKVGLKVYYKIIDPMIHKICNLACKSLLKRG